MTVATGALADVPASVWLPSMVTDTSVSPVVPSPSTSNGVSAPYSAGDTSAAIVFTTYPSPFVRAVPS